MLIIDYSITIDSTRRFPVLRLN